MVERAKIENWPAEFTEPLFVSKKFYIRSEYTFVVRRKHTFEIRSKNFSDERYTLLSTVLLIHENLHPDYFVVEVGSYHGSLLTPAEGLLDNSPKPVYVSVESEEYRREQRDRDILKHLDRTTRKTFLFFQDKKTMVGMKTLPTSDLITIRDGAVNLDVELCGRDKVEQIKDIWSSEICGDRGTFNQRGNIYVKTSTALRRGRVDHAKMLADYGIYEDDGE